MTIGVSGVRKTYRSRRAEVVALDGVDLGVGPGEYVCVVGPSGSGKTTLLRVVAGLEDVDDGRIEIADRDVTAEPPGSRDVAMVFQDLALYPHLSVRDNIAFGLRAQKLAGLEIERSVERMAGALDLRSLLDRRPTELSGGERQRVALARAAVRRPAGFLLDEPLSSLDPQMRTAARAQLRSLQRDLGVSTLHVTHDQTEAMTLGDRVAVLRGGRVEQVGSPRELYDRPASTFVARFIGSPPMNVVPGGVLGRRGEGTVGVRPEHLQVGARGSGVVDGVVEEVDDLGSHAIAHLRVADETLLARVPPDTTPERGEVVGITADEAHLHRFDGESGRALP